MEKPGMTYEGYPYIGQIENEQETVAVLFTRPQTGIVLTPADQRGDLCERWAEESFTKINHRDARMHLHALEDDLTNPPKEPKE